MKKTQRLRLAQLNAQATRTDAEAAEMKELQALADANPDAAKDVDDTKALNAAGFMDKLTAAFKDKAQLAADLSAEKKKTKALEDQLAAGSVGTVTLAAVLGALKLDAATLAGKTADEIATAISAGRVLAEGLLATARTQLGVFCEALGFKSAELATDKATVTTALDAKVQLIATEKLAGLGFPSAGLPPTAPSTSGGGAANTLDEIREQLNAETDPEKAGQLAAKAKALREKADAKK